MTSTSLSPLSLDELPKLRCTQAVRCGGCPQIGLSQKEQRRKKLSWVQTLFFEAHLSPRSGFRFHECAAEGGYRNRIRLRVTNEGNIAFFNEEKSAQCAVLSQSLLSSLCRLLESQEELRSALFHCAHLELRAPDIDGIVPLFLAPKPNKEITQEQKNRIRATLPSPLVAVFQGDPPFSARYPLGQGLYQRVPTGSFMQVNFAVNEALIQEVVNSALAHRVRTVADIYCGSGNFLLPLLSAGLSGIGVESDESALSALRTSAAEQELTGTFVHADALEWARSQTQETSFDLVVLDPPRAGLKEAIGPLARLGASHIALCSCNPKTLARDLQKLVTFGYELEHCTLFDMFEHTDQVEVLVWLRNSRSE